MGSKAGSAGIVVYQTKKGTMIPTLSPFVLKLETYLRMADLKYENNHSGKASKKGKIPWMAVDGKEIADSAFCIQYLNKKHNIDLDKHLDDTQKAVAHAYIKMLEENTFWATLVQVHAMEDLPWTVNEFDVPKLARIPAKLIFKRKAANAMCYVLRNEFTPRLILAKYNTMWGHGIGRHSQEEIHSIATNDIRACSMFLGDKKFFMGDQPSAVDAVIFGFFAEMAYALPHDCWVLRLVNDEYKNLRAYCDRMKEKYWPDWDSKLRGSKLQ